MWKNFGEQPSLKCRLLQSITVIWTSELPLRNIEIIKFYERKTFPIWGKITDDFQ